MFRVLLCIIFIKLFSSSVLAFPNEPDGFRQYKWGMSKEKVVKILNQDVIKDNHFDFSFDKESGIAIKLSSPVISHHYIYNDIYKEVGVVSAVFFDNKLSQFTLIINDYGHLGPYADKENFKNEMVKLYGEPVIEEMSCDKQAYIWRGDTSTMKLWISPASRYLDKEAELVLNIEASWLESARENRSRERDEDKTYQGW